MWGPQAIAKLVNMTPITMVYDTIAIVHGVYKPSYTWGAHIVYLYFNLYSNLLLLSLLSI